MQQPINFLPASYRRRVRERRGAMRQLVLMGVLTALLAVWWLGQSQHTAALRRQAERLENDVRVAHEQMSEVARLREAYKQMRHQMQVQQSLATPLRKTQILATLGGEMPDAVTLTDLALRTDRSEPEAVIGSKRNANKKDDAKQDAAPPRHKVHIELTALAPDDMTVANMLSALKQHGLFTDAGIEYSRTVERYDVTAREFAMRVSIDMNRQFVPRESDGGARVEGVRYED